MRVLVVAEVEERRALLAGLITSTGHEVSATAPARLLASVAASQPDGLVVDGVEHPERARRDLERARAGLEESAAVLLLVAAGSTWLRALPGDMAPALAFVDSDLGAKLDALAGATGASVSPDHARADVRQRAALTWHPETREIVGPEGTVALTTSQAVIIDLLLRRAGVVVPATTLSRALWGDAILDGHGRAAIRSHIYTLRRKLHAIGLDDVLVSAPGWGYRLEGSANLHGAARSRLV